MPQRKVYLILILYVITLSCTEKKSGTDSWTHFRGSSLNGISSEAGIPVSWSDSSNIAWKRAIDGKGWSSPVVLGDQVWVTTSIDNGKELRALCLAFSTGEILFNNLLFVPDTIYRKHAVNSYATPTPAIEDGFVYVHFGRYGTACLNTETGEKVWERTDLQCEHIQGPGSSLLIHKEKLVVHMEGSDKQSILALDKATGRTIWSVDRPQELMDRLGYIGKKAYTTPIVVNVAGRDLMISNGSAVCIAYDIETGKEVWRLVYGEDSTIAMPTQSEGIIYFYAGFETREEGDMVAMLFAVDPSGKGDIENSHVLWKAESPRLQLSTPIVVDGLFYTINSKSVMFCLDAKTGDVVWSERMSGKFNSSPVYADGHLYFSSTGGDTHVVGTGRAFRPAAVNSLEGEIWATPAIAGGAMLIRTSKYLYKITGG